MRLIYIIFFGLFLLVACNNTAQKSNTTTTPATTKVLRHVVLFKFKDGTTPEQTRAIEAAFMDLENQIPELVKDIEFGINNSPEGLNQGLTHCFFVTFANEKDRDTYILHPKHQTFVEKYAKIFVERVTVVDYWN